MLAGASDYHPQSIKEFVALVYSFLYSYSENKGRPGLDVGFKDMARSIPREYLVLVSPTQQGKDEVAYRRMVIDYLKVFIPRINNRIMKECYCEVFSRTPVLCQSHPNYKATAPFPVPQQLFDKAGIDSDPADPQPAGEEEKEKAKAAPTYTVEHLVSMSILPSRVAI